MKLVVLDGYCLNPGDLSWDAFRRFGELVVFDRTRPEQVVERATGAEIAFTNKTPMPGSLLAQLPALRYIGVLATGYNIVDVDAAWWSRTSRLTVLPRWRNSSLRSCWSFVTT